MPATAPVTVVIDQRDDPATTAAALDAHHPAAGIITVHPTPAAGTPAALAHDMLHALGKTVLGAREQHGTWADSLTPAWNAATAWIHAHDIDHVIVVRAHQLTARRIQQLLELRRRTRLRLTLLWHSPPTDTLAQLLNGISHQLTEDLTTITGQPQQPEYTPARRSQASPPPEHPRPQQPQAAWISPSPPTRGQVMPRLPHQPCPGLEHTHATPPVAEPSDHDEVTSEVTARLGTLAHPLHAAALATTICTKARLEHLTLIRAIDINQTHTHIKTHDSPAHRRCRLHALPVWTQPLLAAATHYHQLSGRPPQSTLYPLITSQHQSELANYAAAIRVRLSP
ncbi:hypothetical protein [Streptomyces sp. NPDC093225]|uniref:hypothetical protein n=1 Tax=Streptomyces sp. NPDC093225 TaxID=3366034 RepID=UPI0038230819